MLGVTQFTLLSLADEKQCCLFWVPDLGSQKTNSCMPILKLTKLLLIEYRKLLLVNKGCQYIQVFIHEIC